MGRNPRPYQMALFCDMRQMESSVTHLRFMIGRGEEHVCGQTEVGGERRLP